MVKKNNRFVVVNQKEDGMRIFGSPSMRYLRFFTIENWAKFCLFSKKSEGIYVHDEFAYIYAQNRGVVRCFCTRKNSSFQVAEWLKK